MVLLFLGNDLAKQARRLVVDHGERLNLFMHVPEDDPLDSNRRCGDGMTSGKASQRSKDQAPKTAPEVAAAARSTAPFQLRTKFGSMPALMLDEVIQLGQHLRRSPARKPSLDQVDAYRAVLACMINLDHPVS